MVNSQKYLYKFVRFYQQNPYTPLPDMVPGRVYFIYGYDYEKLYTFTSLLIPGHASFKNILSINIVNFDYENTLFDRRTKHEFELFLPKQLLLKSKLSYLVDEV